jgi:carboxypeptidase C (cathepsin A)
VKSTALLAAVATLLIRLPAAAVADPATSPDKPQTQPAEKTDPIREAMARHRLDRGPGPATKPVADAKSAAAGDKLSVTDGEVTIGGQAIKYRATAGTYQLKDDAGKAKADLFFVAYEKTPRPESADDVAKRPVTFVFNGGPGAASVWLHMGTAGPRRVKLTDLGEAPPPPYRSVENEYSWLDATDLVFIDPVGTGYSRAAAGEDPKQFYGVEEDLRSVADFIRLYTTRNGRWPSPKFLAGESYGTTRAAGLSRHLLETQGIALNGVVLISTVLDFQTILFRPGNEVPYPLYLPSFTAIAHYHKKLPADLQADDLPKTLKAAERFALADYASALAQGSGLSADARAAVAKELARFTGLPVETVLKANLRIDPDLFRKMLLNNQSKVIGRFDARLAGYDPDPLERSPDHDPSFNQFFAAYAGAFNEYARRTLRWESDLPYDVLTGRVQPWNYGRAGSGYLTVADDLEDAMRKSPHTKLMVCNGVYDLATPYLAAMSTVRHLRLSPELRKNVTETFYPAGHMVYHEAGSLRSLHENVVRFIAGATDGR